MGHMGFHAGDCAWVVFQEAPGLRYQCKRLQLERAVRDDNKVKYFIREHIRAIPAQRVFHDELQAQKLCERLNKGR